MSGWGIALRLDDRRPIVTAIEAVGPRTALRGRVVFSHRAAAGDLSLALRELAAALGPQLGAARPAVVVIRSVNLVGRQRRTVLRMHHWTEGVLLQVARISVDRVEVLEGKEIGRICGSSWESAKAEASVLGEDPDAAAAALAGLILVGEA